MHLRPHALLLLLPICITSAFTDFLGQTYPAPIDLASNKGLLPASLGKPKPIFDAYLKENKKIALESPSGAKKVGFSFGVFSIHDLAAAKLQYHYISPEIESASSQGTTTVDGDSVYRMVSISEHFTVFAGLLELTNEEWHRPLADVIAGLADLREMAGEEDPLYDLKWDRITPWALVAQIAGVQDLGLAAAEVLYSYEVTTGNGSLRPSLSELKAPWDLRYWSIETSFCSVHEFIETNRSQPPGFLSWTTPRYNNGDFILLGIAISNIAGKSMATVDHESTILESPGVSSFNPSPPTRDPTIARSAIIASDGFLSTINGLSKFSAGIVQSTLLQAELTRKWMKSITHTRCSTHFAGGPWKAVRYVHSRTWKVTNLYTRTCNSRSNCGCLVLVPEYNAGFTILDTSTNYTLSGSIDKEAFDLVTAVFFGILKIQATAGTTHNFYGTFAKTGSNVTSPVSGNFTAFVC